MNGTSSLNFRLKSYPLTFTPSFTIGVLSGVSYEKGEMLIREAYRRLQIEGFPVYGIWIGRGESKPSGKDFQMLNYLRQEEAFEYLQQCDIVIHPYWDVPSL